LLEPLSAQEPEHDAAATMDRSGTRQSSDGSPTALLNSHEFSDTAVNSPAERAMRSNAAGSPLKKSPLPLGEGQGEGQCGDIPAIRPHPNPPPEGEGGLRRDFLGTTGIRRGVGLDFEDVSICAAGQTILNGVNLVIEPSQHVAIVGVSGA